MQKYVSSLPDASPRFRRIARTGFAFALAAALVIGLNSPLLSQSDKKAETKKSDAKKSKNEKPTPVVQRKVLIFRPETKGGMSDQLTDMIIDVEQGRLRISGRYRSILFLASLPTIRRAVIEQSLSTADVNPPFDSDAKIKKLTQTAGYDMALVTSVDDYQYDADKGQISLVMSARLIDYAGEKPVIRSVGESAMTAEKAAKDDKDIAPALQLARELTEKLMAELLKTKEKDK